MVEGEKIIHGGLQLDLRRRILTYGQKKIFLRNKEFTLIKYFFQNVGKVLSRTEILEEVWDRNIFCASNTVDVHVSTLRKKIKPFSKNAYIKTVPCVGYMFG